jgi:hypothetical protein
MNEYEKFARETIPWIASALFAEIKPQEQYLVVPPGQASKFNLARMTRGESVNIVSANDAPNQLPIRDHGIYHGAKLPVADNQIDLPMVNLLLGEEIAVAKQGYELTVEDIWAAATVYVLARMEELPKLPEDTNAVPDHGHRDQAGQ